MADRSVGSLLAVALSACSGTLDGSDKIDVALLRSRNDDNAAGNGQILLRIYYCSLIILPTGVAFIQYSVIKT